MSAIFSYEWKVRCRRRSTGSDPLHAHRCGTGALPVWRVTPDDSTPTIRRTDFVREDAVIARVAVWTPMPDDDRQWVIDAARSVPGVLDAYHLVGPETGNGLSIAFFEDDVEVSAVKAAISAKAQAIAGMTSRARPLTPRRSIGSSVTGSSRPFSWVSAPVFVAGGFSAAPVDSAGGDDLPGRGTVVGSASHATKVAAVPRCSRDQSKPRGGTTVA
ncbi:hypothetical protein ACLFMI_21415 [Pseudonocardia nantongensis]|uniref:hypothetical protein n=1 Tax=Pseudonocardia nantongensis TaxID=1181885 RepID=UPI00397D838D